MRSNGAARVCATRSGCARGEHLGRTCTSASAYLLGCGLSSHALLAAVSIFGGHNIPTAGGNAFKTGKPMWRTYMNGNGFISDLMGAASLAYNLQSSFLARLGAGIVWGGLAAQPDGQPERAQGLVRADSPVVGAYVDTGLGAAADSPVVGQKKLAGHTVPADSPVVGQ